MVKNLLLLAASGLILGACPPLMTAQVATYFGYSPETPLHLSAGILPQDLARTFAPCIKANEVTIDGAGALKTTFTMSVVTNEHSLQEAMGIDVKVHAAGPFAKGDASFHEDTSHDFDETTAAIVIRGESEYSRHILKDITLSDNAVAALKIGSAEFVEQCGTHVVTTSRTGVMTSIVIVLHHLKQEDKRKITASADVSGGIGAVTASVQAAMTSSFNDKNVADSSIVQVIASGGPGLPGLADVVVASGTPPNLAEMLKALKVFFAGLTKENASPIGFFIAPFPSPAPAPPGDPVYRERMRDLIAISDRYQRTGQLLTAARSILSGTDARSSLLTATTASELQTQADALYKDVQALEIKYHSCARPSKDLSDCELAPEKSVPSILADSPDITLTTLIRTKEELLSPAISTIVFSDPWGGDLPTRLHRRGLDSSMIDVYAELKGAIVGDLSLRTKEDGVIRYTAYPRVTPITKRTNIGPVSSSFNNTLLVGLQLDFARAVRESNFEIAAKGGLDFSAMEVILQKLPTTAALQPDVVLPVLEAAVGYVCLPKTADGSHNFELLVRRLADASPQAAKAFPFGSITKKTKPDGIEVNYKTQQELDAGLDGWTFFIPKGCK